MIGEDLNVVIIIGAGRSGTNILRDVLTSFNDFITWPCDEINYIWRHGNRNYPTDEFSEALARPEVVGYIRDQFRRLSLSNPSATVVEKTCANTLRVPFLYRIFPQAKFIHLIRDGRDVAFSAAERWKAPLDLAYVMKKARYVPKSDLCYYASRYLVNLFHRFTSPQKRVATWGPRFSGMEEVFQSNSVEVASAIQWKKCVESASQGLELVPDQQVHTLRYEDLTVSPADEFEKLFNFLGYIPSDSIEERISRISHRSVGRWRSFGDQRIISSVSDAIRDTLVNYGYQE